MDVPSRRWAPCPRRPGRQSRGTCARRCGRTCTLAPLPSRWRLTSCSPPG